MTKLKEFFEANSYIINVDNYPFTNDKETVLGISEALMAVKGWLLEKRQELQQPEFNPSTYQGSYAMLGREQMIDDFLEELKDIYLPQTLSGKETGGSKSNV